MDELSALNRSRVPDVTTFQADIDIADLKAIAPAFVGQDVVVHLAAGSKGGDWNEPQDSAEYYRL